MGFGEAELELDPLRDDAALDDDILGTGACATGAKLELLDGVELELEPPRSGAAEGVTSICSSDRA